MKIAITGTRGVPNHYGGLEQFAERVSELLVKKGHQVIAYNPHYHPFQEKKFRGVDVVHKWNPEKKIGGWGNFIYDYLCLSDAVKQKCDAILVCGYTTASVSFFVVPFRKSKIITNIDGLEWKRSKLSPLVQKATRWFEKIAVTKSHAVISDNPGIEEYVHKNYPGAKSYMIEYAADIYESRDESALEKFNLKKYDYNIMICRLEPENNIEIILDGVVQSQSSMKMYICARNDHKYGQYLIDKYKNEKRIVFLGWVGGQNVLNDLRNFSALYFHGHSVGGTNPSLLEAMAGGALIAAHGNVFNKNVLGDNAVFFLTPDEAAAIIDNNATVQSKRSQFISNNLHRIKTYYNWQHIADMYDKMFEEVAGK